MCPTTSGCTWPSPSTRRAPTSCSTAPSPWTPATARAFPACMTTFLSSSAPQTRRARARPPISSAAAWTKCACGTSTRRMTRSGPTSSLPCRRPGHDVKTKANTSACPAPSPQRRMTWCWPTPWTQVGVLSSLMTRTTVTGASSTGPRCPCATRSRPCRRRAGAHTSGVSRERPRMTRATGKSAWATRCASRARRAAPRSAARVCVRAWASPSLASRCRCACSTLDATTRAGRRRYSPRPSCTNRVRLRCTSKAIQS
mmetsp:Transcript_650/g.1746  ORF Transcript_650/g.1746 Transcript_650/m.1746 type:complete len:257 (+) Transcript_650:360-1130(+)